ncbi:MAG: phosphonate C-P lyase system protein PhnH [Cyanobacteria bacterium J06598_1]
MMITTQLPGFENLTRDSQKTFRSLLEALSTPGQFLKIDVPLQVPTDLSTACGAACLTLMDLEANVWLQPGFPTAVQDWLRFHTGCLFVENPSEATFAVVNNIDTLTLEQFCWGSAETPESSTTLLVQLETLHDSRPVTISGPGIFQQATISPNLPQQFWEQWQHNHAAYPQGIDVFLFAGQAVMGLPRTVRIQAEG